MPTVKIKANSFYDVVYSNKMMITKAGASVSEDEKKALLKQHDCLEEVTPESKKKKKKHAQPEVETNPEDDTETE